MYRIIDDRATGKTSRLMLIAKENNALFICSNPNAMQTKATAYGIDGIKFISYREFLNDFRGTANTKYVIDEMENFLQSTMFYSAELIGYTLSKE